MILVKTQSGQQVLKDRSVALSPRQRSAFILFDGKRSVADVLAATAPMGVTAGDVEQLRSLGLLGEATGGAAPSSHADTLPAELGLLPERPARSAQQRYADAYPIAIQLTSGMGLRGFRLNLAVESAGSYEQLLAIAPRIREAVGAEKYLPLALALRDD